LAKALSKAALDQATGLRQLFAAEAVRVVALVGSQSQSVAAALAVALAVQDKKVLLVDEALCATTSHPFLEAPLGWDVGDVLRGKKDLNEVLLSVAGVTLMPADTEHLGRSLDAARVEFLDTFHALVVGFDCVIIHAGSDLQRHGIGFALAAAEVIVLCDESDHGITEAYKHIKTLNRVGDDRHFMMMFRGGNEAMAKSLFHKLTAVCDRYLELKLDFACVLPTNRLTAARTLEMFAVDMLHSPLQNSGNGFDAFMCRLLSTTGNNLTAA
jgi:MinD-like ATPase involved in chromosome partitioning or flagellar assembly